MLLQESTILALMIAESNEIHHFVIVQCPYCELEQYGPVHTTGLMQVN